MGILVFSQIFNLEILMLIKIWLKIYNIIIRVEVNYKKQIMQHRIIFFVNHREILNSSIKID